MQYRDDNIIAVENGNINTFSQDFRSCFEIDDDIDFLLICPLNTYFSFMGDERIQTLGPMCY